MRSLLFKAPPRAMVLTVILGAVLMAGRPGLRAQESTVPAGIMTAAATTMADGGQPFGYILLSSPQPDTLRGRVFSVHLKPGAAAEAGEFSPQGVIAPVTNAAAAGVMLERAARLGQDRPELERALRYLYRKASHADYLSRLHNPRQPGDPPWPDDPPQPGEPGAAEQAARIIARAAADPSLARDLDASSLVSPGLALLHGRGWAGPLPAAGQLCTLEIRLREGGVDGVVVGRVELRAGQPLKLPAPGAPVQVPDRTNAGHLAIGIRWASPENLRRLSLLGHGFRVYRAGAEFAEKSGMPATPPDAGVLEDLAEQMPDKVIRLSSALILPPKVFREDNVADFSLTATGDSTTTFHVDRNERCCGRTSPGPFTEGDRFYYFAVACDILGQPGEVSPGGAGVACRTIPPMPPQDVSLKTEESAGSFKVTVSWRHDPNSSLKSPPTHYQILRGVGARPEGQPVDPRISVAGRINDGRDLAVLRQERLIPCGEIDAPAPPAGPPVPPATAHPQVVQTWTDTAAFLQPGESCWYTVRAVYKKPALAGCVDLFSDPAAAAHATRRRTDAPAPPALCYKGNSFPFAVVKLKGPPDTVAGSYPVLESRAVLRCERENEGITHVRFELRSNGQDQVVWEQTVYFPDTKGQPATTPALAVAVLKGSHGKPAVSCTAYSATGAVSRTVSAGFEFISGGSGPRTSMPRITFMAGAWSLNQLPPATSVLRAEVLTTTQATAEAKPVAGQGISSATLNFGALPPPQAGDDFVRAVLIERQVNGVWTDAGGARTTGSGNVFFPGETAGPVRATLLNVAPPAGCQGNVHQRGGADGAAVPVTLGLCLSSQTGPPAEEYRVYRQVDDGPLQLVSLGYTSSQVNGQMAVADGTLPASSSQVQYYAQLVDANGNASPMTALMSCPLKLVSPPPVPVLNRLRAVRPAGGGPEMEVEWYCPAPGVERFQIFVETGKGGGNSQWIMPLPGVLLGGLSGNGGGGGGGGSPEADLPGGAMINVAHQLSVNAPVLTVLPVLNTRSYYTRRVGTGEASLGGGPVYTMRLPVSGTGSYKVWVKSIGLSGGVSAPSNVLESAWSLPPLEFAQTEPRVPWPARPLPAALPGNRFMEEVRVVALPATGNTDGEYLTGWPDNTGERFLRGVVVGMTTAGSNPALYNVNPLTVAGPNAFLTSLTDRPGDLTLPAVLYRRQIPNAEFPQPDGDVIQVSPLIGHIACYRNGKGEYVMVDPYVAVLTENHRDPAKMLLCLIDHQPVTEGAAYQYFLVRFDAGGEMRDVVDAGTTLIAPP